MNDKEHAKESFDEYEYHYDSIGEDRDKVCRYIEEEDKYFLAFLEAARKRDGIIDNRYPAEQYLVALEMREALDTVRNSE
tara:strand:+ start:266 stop:505 length:240 start_codon:yes stop_codon:yes gene_type:complete